MSESLKVPWTDEQVKNMNAWQQCGWVHPFTCGGKIDGKDCRADLIATKDGWICKHCDYKQYWCLDIQANSPPPSPYGSEYPKETYD